MTADHHESSGPVLGLDFGTVRTGMAVSDSERTIARPLGVIERAAKAGGMSQLLEVITEHQVTAVVVGLPLGLDGRDTDQTRQTRSFAARLARMVEIPVQLHDERFTSKLADQVRSETDTATSRDALAACHVLSSWLDRRPDGA